jgi:hypothetical protein
VPAFRHWVGGTGAEVYLLAVRPQPTRIERRGDRIVHLDEQQAEEQATWRCYLTGLRGQLAYAGVVVRQAVQFGRIYVQLARELMDRQLPQADQV